MEDVWRTCGGRVEDVWRTCGGRVEDVWRTCGGRVECGGHIADMLTVKDMLRTSKSGDLRRLRVWSLPGPDRTRFVR